MPKAKRLLKEISKSLFHLFAVLVEKTPAPLTPTFVACVQLTVILYTDPSARYDGSHILWESTDSNLRNTRAVLDSVVYDLEQHSDPKIVEGPLNQPIHPN